MYALEFRQRKFREIAALLLGKRNGPASHVVGVAERQARLAHQPVGEVGGGRVAGSGCSAHAVGADGHVAHHPGHRGNREFQVFRGIEDLFLIFLHVLGVGERQALHDGQQCDERTVDASRLRADQFGRIGVLLLRHDRGAGREGVREADEAELRRRPDDDLLGKPRQVHGADCRNRQEFQRKIAVGYGVDGVAGGLTEAKRLSRHVPVDRETRAGECGGADRAFVQVFDGVAHPLPVPAEHFDIGHAMMAEGDWLCRLQVGEAGHDGIGVLVGSVEKRGDQAGQHTFGLAQFFLHPEAKVERDLVVTGARRVEPSGG